MIKKICFVLECSRIFSTPMALLSWLVVFFYALTQGGNAVFGIIALVGIFFGQLATNLFDDYMDYKVLSKNPDFLNSAQKTKCKYITDGILTLNQTLGIVILYIAISCFTGTVLLYFCGLPVLYFAILGGIFVLFYSKMSIVGLSEFAVFMAFGPILFGGVYWVMTQSLNLEVFLISICVVAFTVNLLYTHTLLDFDGDVTCHKKTLCVRIADKNIALAVLAIIWLIGYVTVILGVLLKVFSPVFLITFLTVPYAVQLYKSMLLYNADKTVVPKHYWLNFPFENLEKLKQQRIEPFMFNLYFARNLMIYFSLLMCVSILLDFKKVL